MEHVHVRVRVRVCVCVPVHVHVHVRARACACACVRMCARACRVSAVPIHSSMPDRIESSASRPGSPGEGDG